MNPRPQVLASRLRFPESPNWIGDGSIALVELQGAALTRIAPDGAHTVLADCGGSPNGCAVGLDGEFYVANNGGLAVGPAGYWHSDRAIPGVVQRIDSDGAVSALTDTLPGPPPRRPNDICFGPTGTLYVTDSANWEHTRRLNPGQVLALSPDGVIVQRVEVPSMPNGVAFGPDGGLYVTQSFTRRVLRFDMDAATIGTEATFATLPFGMPDGLCFAADGSCVVCGSVADAIFVYAPDGELVRTIDTGAGTQPTNCCIGEDGCLYVTYGFTGQLVRFDLRLEPAPVHRGRVLAGVRSRSAG